MPEFTKYFKLYSFPTLVLVNDNITYNLPISRYKVANVIESVIEMSDPVEITLIERIGNTGQYFMEKYDEILNKLGLHFIPKSIKILMTLMIIFITGIFIIYAVSDDDKVYSEFVSKKNEIGRAHV